MSARCSLQVLSMLDALLCRELAGAGVVEALVGMLHTGGAQGQIYSAQALCNMAGDPACARTHCGSRSVRL